MGIFSKISDGLKKTRESMSGALDGMLSSHGKIDEELYEELEEVLIMSDVGVATATEIIERLREKVDDEKIKEVSEVKGAIKEIVADMIAGGEALKVSTKPSVILMIGVNGAGKTTTIGKLALKFKNEGKKVIIGAADTFRAAAIDQLEVWADRAGVPIVKHAEGADPAAVVFDTIAAGKARGADIIICDTAGRLQNKKNLMDELGKISRVTARELPDADKEILLVVDATTGQNAVSQAKLFKEAAGITGIVLTKLDGTARGGIVLSIRDELKIPVKLIGVGEGINDLQHFNADLFAQAMFADISDMEEEETGTDGQAEQLEQPEEEKVRFVLATANRGKMKEMTRILKPMGISTVSAGELGFVKEIEETGTTFEENALIKARTVCNALGMPAIADDSGLCVDALGGAPGVYSARYAGEGADDTANNNKLLDNMIDVPRRKRGAKYVSVIAVALPDGREFTVRGECEGSIAENPRGDGGFGYDPLFKVGWGTMAQLSAEEKDRISHRGKALRKLQEQLPQYVSEQE